MGSLNIAKCLNSSSKHSQSMTAALYLCLLAFHQASLAPQYADQTNQELSGNQLDVFGDSQVEEVDSAHTVKNEAGYTAPDDYHAGGGVADRKKEGEGLGHRGQGAEHIEPLQPVLDKLDLVQLWKGNGQSDL